MASSEPSPNHPSATSPALTLVDATRRAVRARRVRAALAACVVLALGLALGLATADALAGLGEGSRRSLGAGALALGALSLLAIAFSAPRLAPTRAAATRMAEQATGDSERRLSTALELSAMHGELARAGAAHFASGLPASPPGSLSVGRARGLLAVAAAIALSGVAVHLLLPDLWRLEWHRFSDPHGDHPPFSLTAIAWGAAPGRARPASIARFEVVVSGRAPRDVVLRTRAGARERSLPMFQIGASRWAADLDVGEAETLVWAEAGGTRTSFKTLVPDPVPVLSLLDVRVEAPTYARLEPERMRVKPGGQASVAVLPGSRVLLAPTANRALAAVRLRHGDEPAERVPLVDGAALLPDPRPGAYAIALEAADGAIGEPLPMLAITARVDQPPRVTIVNPAHDVIATAGMSIPFIAECDDDLGLARIEKVREHNGLGAPSLVQRAAGLRQRWSATIDLQDLGVDPGDAIAFGAVAFDSLPGAGQSSAFAQRVIRVVSDEDYNRFLMQRLKPGVLADKYAEIARQLAKLESRAAELKRTAAAMPRDELDKRLAELGHEAAALRARVASLHRDKPLFAIETTIQETLSEQARALEEAAAAGDPSRLPDGGVGEMLESDLAQLTQMARAQGLLARLRQLIDAEQMTTQRLEPLAEHRRLLDSDRVRLRELGDQEEELASTIERWLALELDIAAAMRKASPSGDESPLGQDADDLDVIASAVTDTGAIDLKRRAGAAARAGEGDQSHRLAAEARDRLLALLQKAGQGEGAMRGRMRLSLSWCDSSSSGSCLDGLAAAAARGFGLGGSGSAGLGFALGYGGDDFGSSDPSSAMDLYGPESLSDAGGGERPGDGNGSVAAMAAGGEVENRAGPLHRQAVRSTTAVARPTLGADEERMVSDYFQRLEEER